MFHNHTKQEANPFMYIFIFTVLETKSCVFRCTTSHALKLQWILPTFQRLQQGVRWHSLSKQQAAAWKMQRRWILPPIFARVMESGIYPLADANARLVTRLTMRSRPAMVSLLCSQSIIILKIHVCNGLSLTVHTGHNWTFRL